MSDAADRELTTPWEPSEEGLANARRYLGRQLKKRRKDAKLSQGDLATIAGVSRPTYVRFEEGTSIIGYKPLRALATHYGCKMADLLPPPDNYPAAPQDPLQRLEWMRIRNRNIRNLGKTNSEEEA